MTLFLIPARAGSKRLPGKNKRLFCGIPLWMWSLATANRVRGPNDKVVVSSDDPEIYRYGPWEPRAVALCQDETKTIEVVQGFLKFDSVCLLQPTSPTRSDALVRMMLDCGRPCRSVTDGKPNGQCYVWRHVPTHGLSSKYESWTGVPVLEDIETERGFDIDLLSDFEAAEQEMLRRFA